MQSNLPIPAWSQRDPRWAKQRLGTVNGTTIGGEGCLITAIAMMNAGFDPGATLAPFQIDDLFTTHGGYANGNLVIWNKINQLLPNCSTQGQIFCQTTAAPVGDIKAHLDAGHLAVLQVGFGGNANKMHFVLALGYNGDDIIFNDPWYGDRASFASRRYGTGSSSRDILAIHYFADGIPPVKPEVPVAKPTVPGPEPTPEPVPAPAENVPVETATNVTVTQDPVLEPTPEPEPQPPVEEPTPAEPAPEASPLTEEELEEKYQWNADATIPQKYVSNESGADVVDVVTGEIVKTLPHLELVAPLAGYFKADGFTYLRTQSSANSGRWNGVRELDVSDYIEGPPQPQPGDIIQPTPPAPTAPVDAIQPPPAGVEEDPEVGSIFDDPEFEDPTDDEPDTTPRIPTEDILQSVRRAVMGILLAPLRLLGRIGKLIKGVEKVWKS